MSSESLRTFEIVSVAYTV